MLVKITNTNQSPFEFPKAEYVIDRIAQKTSISLTVELANTFELQNVKVPSRVVTGKYCPWDVRMDNWKC